MNIKQFNGRCGCLYCTHPGDLLHPGRMVYLPTTPFELQTNSKMRQWATQTNSSGQAVFEVRGPSPLSQYINFVNGVPVDYYMHAVLESVVKHVTNLWFNSKNHRSPFYLCKSVNEIDRILVNIRPPPTEVHRSPRPIATTLKF